MVANLLTREAVPLCAEESTRAQVISLDGLLDYDEGDSEEATMELSLAAEALQEMLSRDYGDAILHALLTERRGPSLHMAFAAVVLAGLPDAPIPSCLKLSVENVVWRSFASRYARIRTPAVVWFQCRAAE